MADFAVPKKAFKPLSFTVKDIPSGRVLERAKFVVKDSLSDLDADAHVTKEITTDNDTNGHISDTGADGTGVVKAYIQPTDLNDLTPGRAYYYALKVFLDDDKPYLLTGFTGVFLVTDMGVEAPAYDMGAGTGEYEVDGNAI